MKCWQRASALWSAALCGCLAFGHAAAQGYPTKPVRLLVGFAPGGGTDTIARVVAQKLTESLGQSLVVENRPGGGGILASEAVSRAPADGYTLLMIAAAESIQPAMRAKMPYDLRRDLSPISLVSTGPFVLVIHPSVPARTVKELIAIAQARKVGGLNYASSGVGSSAHMTGELFNSLANVTTTHVPYKGASQQVVATVTGEIDFSFPGITAARPLLESGRLRGLAVTTIKRTVLLPDMPSLHESGVTGFDRTGWYGLLGPAGIPKDILIRLSSAVDKALNTQEMKASLFKQGMEPATNTPEQFAEFLRGEVEQNIRLVRAAGIKPE